MKKSKKFTLQTMTDIKVFLLFLLDHIRYPIDHPSLIGMVSENTEKIVFDYDECLRELSDGGYILLDDMDGERYYMITESGASIAAELYDTLDKEFRERSLKYAAKYTSLSRTGSKIEASVEQMESKMWRVTVRASDSRGEIMCLSLAVNSREEADRIKSNYESRPDGLYRGVLFAATGRLEFLS